MPHLSAHRHHVYRVGLAMAVGVALVAAGFGLLPVAARLRPGVALPGMLLTYFYDHEIWSDEPALMLGLSIGLAGALGAGLGFVCRRFQQQRPACWFYSFCPSLRQLLSESLILPLAALSLLLIPPSLMTLRPKFRHVLDIITVSALGARRLLARGDACHPEWRILVFDGSRNRRRPGRFHGAQPRIR